MNRRLRGLGALLILLLVVVGAPAALAGWGRPPVDWPAALTRPDDGSVLLVVLTVGGWLGWAAFTASTAAELARLLGGRAIRLPLLGALQRASSGLLLAVLALAPATPAGVQPPAAAVPAAEPEPPAPTRRAGSESPAGYVVAPGDDLWTISAELLGSGARWRELAAANPDQLRDPTARLQPGTRLVLPARSTPRPRHIRVERGDTLSGLALEHLGAAGRWPSLARANKDLVEDPDHIEVGWRLRLPGAPPAPRARSEPDGAQPAPPRGREPAIPEERVDPPPTAVQPPQTDTATGRTGEPAPPDPDAADDGEPALPLLGTLGTLAAAAIVGAIELRRALRLRERPVGRRLLRTEDQAARLRTALGARQEPDRVAALDTAMRAIGRHCHRHGLALPRLDRITIDQERIAFDWHEPAGLPPAGFEGTANRWTRRLPGPLDGVDHPCPYPAVVSLGATPGGDLVLVDAEQSRVLGVAADDAELQRSALAAMAVELACAPWAAEAELVVAGPDAGLVRLAGGDRVRELDVAGALAELRALVARRREGLGTEALADLRVDPDRAPAVAAVVFCFLTPEDPALAAELDEVLAGPPTGVVAVLAAAAGSPAQWQVHGDRWEPTGRLAGSQATLLANGIPEPVRAGLARLLEAADDPATEPAPWWSGADDNILALPQRAHRAEEPVDIVRVIPPAEHPQVLLIGPAELHGAVGAEPSRSRQQLIEACAWLLEHPGSTATAMAAALGVAEGTRRSNLSRLRNWLGQAPDGTPYLPDAYSGRILLHPGVGSDWHRLQLLLRPGVDRVGDSTLVAALELVRGAPLADAAPGQWHWAEELRADISSALRDVGLVLSERALARGDIDLARWAAARALVVAPEDELLLCARIRTEHRAGNSADVERLVNQVARQARILGVDLLPETVELCQQVVEGRVRARQA